MNDIISPIRRKYDILALAMLGFVLLGAIPMGFCESLEGFFLVYFIVYLSIVVSLLIVVCIAFPFVRKAEIKFFKNKFNIENMEKLVNFNFKNEDFIFYVDGVDVELKNDKIKNLLDDSEYSYDKLKIYASYQCGFAGEIYKIFINFENKEQTFSLKLDNVLYSIIKYYKISVDYLEDVMNECENNLNIFFKSKKLKKEAWERKLKEDLNESLEPILKLFGEKASYSNFEVNIKYHNDFIIKYDFAMQTMFINERYYYSVEEQDLFDFLSEINSDMYYIVEYKFKRLSTTPYFKFLSKKKTDVNKIRKSNNVLRIFDIHSSIYNKKQAI